MTDDHASGATPPVPVSLLTGFLGSGKTTILNQLMRDPANRRTLVLINEFGSIPIDHDLVASAQEDAIIELSSGCLCCTIRGDLSRALIDAAPRAGVAGAGGFDRVIIETTGLADPVPILQTLMIDDRVTAHYQLESVVTVVDAATGAATLDAQDESVRQAAVADRLLMTKTDLVSDTAAEALRARLAAINPGAVIQPVTHGAVTAADLFRSGLYDPATKQGDVQAWLNAEAYAAGGAGHHDAHHHHRHGDGHGHHHDVNRHDDRIRSFCLTLDRPLDAATAERLFDVIMDLAGPRMLRVKGILHLAELGLPTVIHGVQHIFHPPVILDAWPSADRRSRIVFITRDLDEGTVRSAVAGIADGVEAAGLP